MTNHNPDADQNPGGFVTSQPAADGGTDILIVLGDGVHTHHVDCGLTEDDLLD